MPVRKKRHLPRNEAPLRQPFALESRFDAAFTARLALREKQVQQSYRPIISIHKWFARRPGTLFRNLLLSEFGDGKVSEEFWQPHNIDAVIADPFMGGGTTMFEALRLGAGVVGRDVNPMAYWLVRQGIEKIDLDEFAAVGEKIWLQLLDELGELYKTRCEHCDGDATVKYFLWVKTCRCPHCASVVSLFPGYRIAEAVRHPREVYHCPRCDRLREMGATKDPRCPECATSLKGNASRGKATCLDCQTTFAFAPHLATPPEHRLFAIEYQCVTCYPNVKGRQFKTPDSEDHQRVEAAGRRLGAGGGDIPDDAIPEGDETNRLLRWGYQRYRAMFNDRQLVGLSTLLRLIREVPDQRQRYALATVFSDFLRYQNLLCRYDTYALKCQDIFSVHGFPVGLIACENNLPGTPRVGSGSFIHFVEKFRKAKRYAQQPFEISHDGGRKRVLPIRGESAEAALVAGLPRRGEAWLDCAPSQEVPLGRRSLDGVFTDPPYFDNVQYAELMDFCFVWLRKLLSDDIPAFRRASTRTEHELTGNDTLNRGLVEFTTGISAVFQRMRAGLKEGAPLVFTYHHNQPAAYAPLVVALLDAGLTCTATLPAPAEMAASLHIAGTGSSILDSIFVCRSAGFVADNAAFLPDRTEDLGAAVDRDVAAMLAADYACTRGDVACLQAGHIAGQTVRDLVDDWDLSVPVPDRIAIVTAHMASLAVSTGSRSQPPHD
ncbi:Adenine-specific DNA methylase, contains a Zn-ribbon domain [Micromonospora rifamycinica]|uniref:Adenine-specific DNA methylase, contains a Zn-ribbon domain n=1 Tax=Micromonospora rifamycinica TaxID=291594 RepID=A0A1C5KE80_9ACTN|nr:Adenine-specific DNA methylase, contains a Zn-ribbon domain [Micromonospora rifamycinica]